MISDATFEGLTEVRSLNPEAIAAASRSRRKTSVAEVVGSGDVFLVAADHAARGALAVGTNEYAIADRRSLLDRITTALENPRVDGVLASADVIEDLLLLDVLDDRLVIGSMNRGGLAGSTWELDDRFTGHDAAHIEAMGMDGGKMLLRIDLEDSGTLSTMEACAGAVTNLADRSLMAMIEPLPAYRTHDGDVKISSDPDDLVRAVSVASGLGATSAYTWLKLPAVEEIRRVMHATTLPTLILGGETGSDPNAAFSRWRDALKIPQVRGLVVGRALLYPSDGDVAGAVERAAQLLEGGRHG